MMIKSQYYRMQMYFVTGAYLFYRFYNYAVFKNMKSLKLKSLLCIVHDLLLGNGFMKPRWGENVEEFRRRFDPETTSGEGTV